MIDRGLEMLIPFLIAERHQEARAGRAAALVARRPGLRTRSAALLARLALALDRETTLGNAAHLHPGMPADGAP